MSSDTSSKKDNSNNNEKENNNNKDNKTTTTTESDAALLSKFVTSRLPLPRKNNSNKVEILVGVTCFRSKTQIPFVIQHVIGQQHVDKVDDPQTDASFQMKLILSLSALCKKKILQAHPFLKCSVHTHSTCTRPAVDLIMGGNYCSWHDRDMFFPVMSPSCGRPECVHTGRPFARKMALKAASSLGSKKQDDSSSPSTQRRCEACDLVERVGDPNGKLVRCSRCKLVWYCSRKCQKAHWKHHKAMCAKPLLSKSTTHQSTDWFCPPVKQKLLVFQQREAELNRCKEELRAHLPLIDSLFAESTEETEEMRRLKESINEVL